MFLKSAQTRLFFFFFFFLQTTSLYAQIIILLKQFQVYKIAKFEFKVTVAYTVAYGQNALL